MDDVTLFTNAHLMCLCNEKHDLEIKARQITGLHAKHPVLVRLRAVRMEIEATISLLHIFKINSTT